MALDFDIESVALAGAEEWGTRLGLKQASTGIEEAIRADWASWVREVWHDFSSTLVEYRFDFGQMEARDRMRVSDVAVIFESAYGVYRRTASKLQRDALAHALVQAMSPKMYASGLVRTMIGLLGELDGGHVELLNGFHSQSGAGGRGAWGLDATEPLVARLIDLRLVVPLQGPSVNRLRAHGLSGLGERMVRFIARPPILTAAFVYLDGPLISAPEAAAAALDALNQAGRELNFTVNREFPYVIGSWLQRFRLWWTRAKSTPEVAATIDPAMDAARSKYVDKPKSEVALDYSTFVANIMNAMGQANGIDNVAFILDTMLIVRFKAPDGTSSMVCKQLTRDEQDALASSPGVLTDPRAIVEILARVQAERAALPVGRPDEIVAL